MTQDTVLETDMALGAASSPETLLGPDWHWSQDEHCKVCFEPRARGCQLSPCGGSRVWGAPRREWAVCQEEPHPGWSVRAQPVAGDSPLSCSIRPV